MRYFNGLCLCLPNIYFISFILVVKSKTLGKANLITIHAQAKNPKCREDKERSFNFKYGGKPQRIIARKTQAQSGWDESN